MTRTWFRRPAALLAVPAVVAMTLAAMAPAMAGESDFATGSRRAGSASSRAPAAVTAQDAAGTSHRVAAGETLSGLSERYGVTTAALVAVNGISDPDLIRADTVLTIPDGAQTATAATSDVGFPPRLRRSPDRLALVGRFEHWADANGVPADLLMATTWLESGWQNDKVSPDGAVGIGQLMPDTVDFTEMLIGRDLDPHRAEDNIRMSARYLRWLLARYDGDARTALAGYYQGPSSVERRGPLAETTAYVDAVVSLRQRFR